MIVLGMLSCVAAKGSKIGWVQKIIKFVKLIGISYFVEAKIP